MKFLAKIGTYEACGIFSLGHLLIAFFTFLAVIMALFISIKKKVNVKKAIRIATITMLIWEVIMIIFKINRNGYLSVNSYLPFYFCSIFLYAGILSSFGKGKVKRIGDVFLSTGTIIGSVIYIIYPSTSLPDYPLWHLVTLHGFMYHGVMLYIGILINLTGYIKLELKDIIYYAFLVGLICLISLIINYIFGSNLMFISEKFSVTPMQEIYDLTGRFYPLFIGLVQMFGPFYTIYGIIKLLDGGKKCVRQ